MNNKFYSVDEISTMLSMHVKTIQRYIREGKIKANKIGKAYQVSGHDLSEFIGTINDTEVKPTKTSSVIDLHITDKEEVMNITNQLLAGKQLHGGNTVSTMYIEEEFILRVVLNGNLRFTENMMSSIRQLTERED